jgi:putative serine protease PepD
VDNTNQGRDEDSPDEPLAVPPADEAHDEPVDGGPEAEVAGRELGNEPDLSRRRAEPWQPPAFYGPIDLPPVIGEPDRLPRYGYPVAQVTARQIPPPEARRKPGFGFLAIVAGIVGSLLTLGVVAVMGEFADDATVATTTPETTVVATPDTVVQIREIITEGDDSGVAKAVAAKVVPSIVTVEIGSASSDGGFSAFGSGSGVVLTADGLIATNHHVIEDSDDTRVVFQNGRIYEATVVGSDRLTDLAVLRISATDLIPIALGATEGLAIGDRAIAVGNPLGLRGGASLTVGVVSAFDREVQVGVEDVLVGMLQTDAPITQGSSGGALVDREGRLIGITSAIGVSEAGAEGIGFAIPVELVERITSEIIELGEVRHAFLGVSLDDSFTMLDDGSIMPDGALITDFAGAGLAAEIAGLEPGDVVVRYDGTAVETRDDLIIGIRQYRVGETVELEVRRDDASVIVAIVLGERPTDV